MISVNISSLLEFLLLNDEAENWFEFFSIITFTVFSPLLNLCSIAGSIFALTTVSSSRVSVNSRMIFLIMFL